MELRIVRMTGFAFTMGSTSTLLLSVISVGLVAFQGSLMKRNDPVAI